MTLFPPISRISILLLLVSPVGQGSKYIGICFPSGSLLVGWRESGYVHMLGFGKLGGIRRLQMLPKKVLYNRPLWSMFLPSLFEWVAGICPEAREFTAERINKMWRLPYSWHLWASGFLVSLWSFGPEYFLCSHKIGLDWDEQRDQAASAFACM